MEREKIKIGYVATRRECFSHPEAMAFRMSIKEKISGWEAEPVDFAEDELLYTMEGAQRAIEKFREAEVDGIFIANCNFGEESVVGRIAKEIGKPVLLWGPRDGAPKPGEERTRDTQCGLFAVGKVLRRLNVPFTYLVNSALDDSSFENGYRSFIAVCAVVKNFKRTRILQISVRPQPFWTVICNEGELLEKYGIEVFPITLQDIRNRIEELAARPTPEVDEALEMFYRKLDTGDLSREELLKAVRLYVAMKEFCRRHGCNSIATNCWGPIREATGAATCTINGMLTDEGIPVACETDVHGAISSILMKSAVLSARAVFFADLTIRHPENDNGELLWHCGNFPPSLAADPSGCKVERLNEPGQWPMQSQWEIRHGDMTVCRFDGDHGEYQLLIGEGRGVEGPATRGTYSWFEVKDWPYWEEHLVKGPYIHHCSGVHGKVAHILYEACRYLGIKADPVEPSAAELEARWRSGR